MPRALVVDFIIAPHINLTVRHIGFIELSRASRQPIRICRTVKSIWGGIMLNKCQVKWSSYSSCFHL